MKKLLLIIPMVLFTANCFAQSEQLKRTAFHFSFFPPLSTNGINAARYTNGASVSLLVGISGNEENFSFAGLATLSRNDMNGFQLAGLLNSAGNSGSGFMFAGLANIVKNNYHGFQFSGLYNSAGTMSGFQFGGLANVAGNMHGFQFAGLGNVAKDFHGFQFGGLFNVARDVSGVQFAGLFNIARSSDYPIALINIIRDGEYGISASYNEMGSILATFRSGGRVTYGILGAGYNHKAKDKGVVMEGGFGARINALKWLRINNEIKAGSIGNFSSTSTFYSNFAVLPAFRISHRFEVFGGPSINYMNSDNEDNVNLFPNHSLWKKYKPGRLQQLHIGYQAGIQISL